jgi:hypothetical protein
MKRIFIGRVHVQHLAEPMTPSSYPTIDMGECLRLRSAARSGRGRRRLGLQCSSLPESVQFVGVGDRELARWLC